MTSESADYRATLATWRRRKGRERSGIVSRLQSYPRNQSSHWRLLNRYGTVSRLQSYPRNPGRALLSLPAPPVSRLQSYPRNEREAVQLRDGLVSADYRATLATWNLTPQRRRGSRSADYRATLATAIRAARDPRLEQSADYRATLATHPCRAFTTRPRASRTTRFPACRYLPGFAARRSLGGSAGSEVDDEKAGARRTPARNLRNGSRFTLLARSCARSPPGRRRTVRRRSPGTARGPRPAP